MAVEYAAWKLNADNVIALGPQATAATIRHASQHRVSASSSFGPTAKDVAREQGRISMQALKDSVIADGVQELALSRELRPGQRLEDWVVSQTLQRRELQGLDYGETMSFARKLLLAMRQEETQRRLHQIENLRAWVLANSSQIRDVFVCRIPHLIHLAPYLAVHPSKMNMQIISHRPKVSCESFINICLIVWLSPTVRWGYSHA